MIGHHSALKHVKKRESTLDYPRFDLQGQVAVVTGASKGIGYGLAKALANAGAKVAAAARDTDALERLAGEIRAEGGEALPVYLDVRDVGQIRKAMQHIASHFGQIDILVNNAGLGANHPALDVTEDDWDTMLQLFCTILYYYKR